MFQNQYIKCWEYCYSYVTSRFYLIPSPTTCWEWGWGAVCMHVGMYLEKNLETKSQLKAPKKSWKNLKEMFEVYFGTRLVITLHFSIIVTPTGATEITFLLLSWKWFWFLLLQCNPISTLSVSNKNMCEGFWLPLFCPEWLKRSGNNVFAFSIIFAKKYVDSIRGKTLMITVHWGLWQSGTHVCQGSESAYILVNYFFYLFNKYIVS